MVGDACMLSSLGACCVTSQDKMHKDGWNCLSVHACRQIQIYSNLTKLKLLIRIKQIYLTGGVEMLVSSVRGARTTVAVQKQENIDTLLLRKLP